MNDAGTMLTRSPVRSEPRPGLIHGEADASGLSWAKARWSELVSWWTDGQSVALLTGKYTGAQPPFPAAIEDWF